MIDPHNLPAGRMSREYLEEWILFGILVANKPAQATAKKLHHLLTAMGADLAPYQSPFTILRVVIQKGVLRKYLLEARTGQYSRIERALREVVNLDLDNLTVEALEGITGIGPKTARMLMLYYKPELELAPLDTHILKFLRAEGYDAPANTPTGRKYLELEAAFIGEARKRSLTPFQLDKQVWHQYAIQN